MRAIAALQGLAGRRDATQGRGSVAPTQNRRRWRRRHELFPVNPQRRDFRQFATSSGRSQMRRTPSPPQCLRCVNLNDWFPPPHAPAVAPSLSGGQAFRPYPGGEIEARDEPGPLRLLGAMSPHFRHKGQRNPRRRTGFDPPLPVPPRPASERQLPLPLLRRRAGDALRPRPFRGRVPPALEHRGPDDARSRTSASSRRVRQALSRA